MADSNDFDFSRLISTVYGMAESIEKINNRVIVPLAKELSSYLKAAVQNIENSNTTKQLTEFAYLIMFYDRLRNNGWLITKDLNYNKYKVYCNKISDSPTDTKAHIDGFVFEIYSNELVLNAISELATSGAFSDRNRELISEASFLYKHGIYNSCSMILVSIIEGTLARFTDNFKSTSGLNLSEHFHKMVLEEGGNLKAWYYYPAISTFEFLGEIFSFSDFLLEEPQFFHRHWVMHGRSNRINTKDDCIRLVQALQNVVVLFREIDGLRQ